VADVVDYTLGFRWVCALTLCSKNSASQTKSVNFFYEKKEEKRDVSRLNSKTIKVVRPVSFELDRRLNAV